MVIKVWFRIGDNRAKRLNAKINKDTGLLDVVFEKQTYSYHIVTRPIITDEPRKILWFMRVSIDNYFVDRDYNKTIGFEQYMKSDSKTGKIDDMPPQTLSDVVDFAMMKAMAAKGSQAMLMIMLLAGACAGCLLGAIAVEIFIPCKSAVANTVLMPSGSTVPLTGSSVMTGSAVNSAYPGTG